MKKISLLIITLFMVGVGVSQTITSFPYFTGFEGVHGTLNDSFPAGWTYEDLNTNSNNASWEIIKNSSSYINARTDSTAMHILSNMGEANNDWLYTAGIQMTSGTTYTLIFWYNTKPFGSTVEKLKIHIGKDTISTAMSASPLWDQNSLSNITYQQATINFTAPDNDIYFFGFHAYSAALQFILYIDDVSIHNDYGIGIQNPDQSSDIKVGPIPCNDVLTFSGFSIKTKHNIEVYNPAGQLVHKENFSGENYELETNHLIVGNYFIRVISQNNNIEFARQITIRH